MTKKYYITILKSIFTTRHQSMFDYLHTDNILTSVKFHLYIYFLLYLATGKTIKYQTLISNQLLSVKSLYLFFTHVVMQFITISILNRRIVPHYR